MARTITFTLYEDEYRAELTDDGETLVYSEKPGEHGPYGDELFVVSGHYTDPDDLRQLLRAFRVGEQKGLAIGVFRFRAKILEEIFD